MFGDREGVVTELRAFDLHGVVYRDVGVTFPDGTTQSARLGPEAVPEDLAVGDRVVAKIVANMVIGIARAPAAEG